MMFLRSCFFFLVISLFISNSETNAQCDTDTIPPVALIVDLSSAVIQDTNQVELYAIDFVVFANDNCSNSDSLRYTFSPTIPEDDNNYLEEFKSSTMIYDCHDVQNSPILVYIYIWDEAGNTTSDNVHLTLVTSNGEGCTGCEMDIESPTILDHIDEVTWVIPEGADSVDIWASDFIWSATDNCTATDLIKMSFTPVSPYEDPSSSSMFLYCSDVENSPIEVEVYVWDKAGNYTMVTSLINLQNHPQNPDCDEGLVDIEGKVISLKGEPIFGATVYLENEPGDVLESILTNVLGQYSFSTNTENNYLRVEYSDSSSPELSFHDMIAIQQYLLGLTPFSGPQQLAADVNSDGRVRANDLKMFRKIILGVIEAYDHVSSDWQFVDQDYDSNIVMDGNRIMVEGNEGPTIVGYRIGDVK